MVIDPETGDQALVQTVLDVGNSQSSYNLT